MKNIKNELSDNKIHDYLNPDYVYIPILDGYRIDVEENSKVYKEDILLTNKDDLHIYSPISGKVIGKTSSLLLKNKQVTCLVIENDFKESVRKNKGVVRYISDYSKSELIDLIKTYQASKVNLYNQAKHLYINGINKEANK